MAQAASIHALEKARRISDYVMVPIGGAGPVHACNIALKLGLPRVLCPLGAGVASALGFLVAPVAFTLVQGGIVALDELDYAAMRASLAEMTRKGLEMVQSAGATPDQATVVCVAAMRYVGQGYDIDVVVAEAALVDDAGAALRAAFDAAYLAQFNRTEAGMPVEIVSWRVTVSGADPQVDLVAGRPLAAQGDARRGSRKVYFGPEGGFVDVPVYDRYRLAPGSRFDGPAVFEERESTTVVPPGASAKIDAALNLVVELPVDAAQGAHP
jgi:N-methylhydantoinase A